MMTFSPRPRASLAYSIIRMGVRCAETMVSSNVTPSSVSISAASFITERSDWLPMIIPTCGLAISGYNFKFLFYKVDFFKQSRLIAIHNCHVSHLAERLGEPFAVQVNMRPRQRQDLFKTHIPGRTAMPRFAQQIHHSTWANHRCVACWQVENSPKKLFVLRCHIGLDGVMPAVVRTRCNFIDQNISFSRNEHFHRKQSHDVQLAGNLSGDGVGLLLQLGCQPGR